MLTPLADVEQSTHSISAQDAWHLCLLRLSQEIDPQIFSAYFEPLELIEGNADSFSIGAPNRFICSQLDRHFRDKLTGVLSSILGSDSVNINFSVSEGSQQPQSRLQNTASASRQALVSQASLSNQQSSSLRSAAVARAETNPATIQSPIAQRDQIVDSGDSLSGFGRSSAINPKYSFDNFVVGSSNQFCHAAALRVAESPGNSYNPLFIYGGVGLGKTHLLHSIGNEVLRRNPKATILYLSSEAFTNELILALRQAKMDEFKKRMRNIEVLLIDDIQFISGKERTQEEFFHTFNALYSAKRQIVITSDKIPSEIPGIEERLQTRFSWGLMADLQAPDFETRVAILNRKAAVDQVALPEEVAHLVAERVSSNVRELEGALTRLHALSSLQNVPITLKSASATLEPLLQPKTINVSIDDIKKAVATHFNLKVADMTSKRRTKNLSFPRHIAMYLCRKHTTCSYPEIGGQFGGRDHSSVIHAASVVSGKVASDAKVKEMIEGIERNLLTP